MPTAVETTTAPTTPTIFIVLGVTGDLMARKLAPALLQLFTHQQCPEHFRIIGFSRRNWNDEQLRATMREALRQHAPSAKPADVEQFLQLMHYQAGNFDEPGAYQNLLQSIKATEAQWGQAANRLFYLAVPPDLYGNLFRRLADCGLMAAAPNTWARLLVEKPFGRNLAHAMELDTQLKQLFADDQIYRIDHYLAKEMIQDILRFRFANNFLAASWSKHAIERIEVRLWEKLDIEGRGSFYDATGALLDVGQNHLLQMLALVTMRAPADFSAEAIRDRRAEILEQLQVPQNLATASVRAQYEGYLHEPEVAPQSRTETFFRLRTYLNNPDWQGVPIYLEAGKKMPANNKEVVVTFQHPEPCFCPPGEHLKNQLLIQIAPQPRIAIRFYNKKPGSSTELQEQWLNFEYRDEDGGFFTEEYTQLLARAMAGDSTLFVSSRETLASWRFIDPIVEQWRAEAADTQALPAYRDEQSLQQITATLDTATRQAKLPIGIVGVGKMGHNLALHLQERGWPVAGLARHTELTDINVFHDAEPFLARLGTPKVIWLMVPYDQVDHVLFDDGGLVAQLTAGGVIIDGGNSHWTDTVRRADELKKRGLVFLDCGTSGGPAGARHGACLMIGGKRADFERFEYLFADVAAAGGYKFFEGHGAGHFVKMVHNGIEYGMMQAIAEGFTVLRRAEFSLDVQAAAEVYNHGSVIESRLIDWLQKAFELHGVDLNGVTGVVGHTGEGEWTVEAARALDIRARVIEAALQFRIESEHAPSYTGQLLSAMREQFGGHSITGEQTETKK